MEWVCFRHSKSAFSGMIFGVIFSSVIGCKNLNSIEQTTLTLPTPPSSRIRFAEGQKLVKIFTRNTNAFPASFDANNIVIPNIIPIPVTLPGGEVGTYQYRPGISAQYYFDERGNPITKPDWLLDFQLGLTQASAGSAACATFGGSGQFDIANAYRVSEANCTGGNGSSSTVGMGRTDDRVFFRLILDRNQEKIGTNENLTIQIEYQASGIVPFLANVNSNPDPESKTDQLWKIFWGENLIASQSPTQSMNSFGMFVPPNQSFCLATLGAGTCASALNTNNFSYRGAPVRTKQIQFPLSALQQARVIQFSRLRSWGTDGILQQQCPTNSPICLGVAIHSVTLIRN